MIEFLTKKVLKDNSLLYLCNNINNHKLVNLYGDMKFTTYITLNTKCDITVNYNKIKNDYNGNYMELLFTTLYVIFHEVEHIKQVRILMDKNSYINLIHRKLAVRYRAGFFLEEKGIGDYNDLLIEYNAKLVGMISALSFIQNNLLDVFDNDFICQKYLEITNMILSGNNNKFDSCFERHKKEYMDSDYLKRIIVRSACEKHNASYTYFDNDFLNQQFLLLLLGENNVFRKIAYNNPNIGFDNIIFMTKKSVKSIKR